MKRPHRTAHRAIWIVLAICIAASLTMALVKRKPQKKKAEAGAVMLVATAHYMPAEICS